MDVQVRLAELVLRLRMRAARGGAAGHGPGGQPLRLAGLELLPEGAMKEMAKRVFAPPEESKLVCVAVAICKKNTSPSMAGILFKNCS